MAKSTAATSDGAVGTPSAARRSKLWLPCAQRTHSTPSSVATSQSWMASPIITIRGGGDEEDSISALSASANASLPAP